MFWQGVGGCTVKVNDNFVLPQDLSGGLVDGYYTFAVSSNQFFATKQLCEADLYRQCKNKGILYGNEVVYDGGACYMPDTHAPGDPIELPDGVDNFFKDLLDGANQNQNYRDLRDLDPVYTPQSPRIPVPDLAWVMDYIKNHWDEFSLGLVLAILGVVILYFGGNAFLAFITGGGSLPSLGATAPILAAVLVAILMKHGALNHVPQDTPRASVEELYIEIDEENNEYSIYGTINGQALSEQSIALTELSGLYVKIKSIKSNQKLNKYTSTTNSEK
ncbi:MAG TPA: hypothetical protein PKC21_08000 [Oligoflexia bacterium]|nr:hypothetical protein [Oligoflexia bacterium]HMR25280.1 hypothetical protein [Oligoflexia bacterium]